MGALVHIVNKRICGKYIAWNLDVKVIFKLIPSLQPNKILYSVLIVACSINRFNSPTIRVVKITSVKIA